MATSSTTSSSSDEDKYLVKIETQQPNNLKVLFMVLKEHIIDANIVITQDRIEILEMETAHTVVVHVQLQATNFDRYHCKKPIKIGIDTVNLTKVLKGVSTKDILTLFVEDSNAIGLLGQTDATHPFGLLIENPEKGQSSKVYINTLDVNENQLEVPDLSYPYHITLPSSDLQSIVTSMKNIGGEVIRLTYHNETLTFYTKGEFGVCELTRSRTCKEDNSLKITKNNPINDHEIIQVYLKLQKLVEFTKCCSLSNTAILYLKNDFPVFLEYDVGSLGFIRLGLSSHIKPATF